MSYRNSVLLGTLGGYHDRFHHFQPPKTFEERLRVAEGLRGADGVEPVYPNDLGHEGEHASIAKACDLPISAVNVNIKGEPLFRAGALTHPDADVRSKAVSYLRTAMDLAVELGTDMVSVCPLIDGWDHAFEVDYPNQWRWLREGISDAASHRSDVRISIEYKPFEVRNHIVVPSMARTLLLCSQIGADNVGVTMDVGHAISGGETPAAELCLAHDQGRLFYVHFNDNDRRWDWDTLPGSVNLWETLETLYWVRRLGWSGWFAYDVFTRKGDGAEGVEKTFAIMEHLDSLLDKIGMDEIRAHIEGGTPASTYEMLISGLL